MVFLPRVLMGKDSGEPQIKTGLYTGSGLVDFGSKHLHSKLFAEFCNSRGLRGIFSSFSFVSDAALSGEQKQQLLEARERHRKAVIRNLPQLASVKKPDGLLPTGADEKFIVMIDRKNGDCVAGFIGFMEYEKGGRIVWSESGIYMETVYRGNKLGQALALLFILHAQDCGIPWTFPELQSDDSGSAIRKAKKWLEKQATS